MSTKPEWETLGESFLQQFFAGNQLEVSIFINL